MDPALRAAYLVDYTKLIDDIRSALPSDSYAQEHKDSPRWSANANGLLLLDGRIYVPNVNNLCTRVLQFKHDHPLAGHPGQSKTLELVRHDFVWPQIRTNIINFIQSCTSCSHAKIACHKPYGILQQLPIPPCPW